MNKQQAKELLPVIQAFADGKTIQYYYGGADWVDVKPNESVDFSDDVLNYRIKPKPKCRPFKDLKECWKEMQKHQPFGWVKASHGYFEITGIKAEDIGFGITDNFLSYEYLFTNYLFADGTPFGIKVEK